MKIPVIAMTIAPLVSLALIACQGPKSRHSNPISYKRSQNPSSSCLLCLGN